MKAYTGLSKPVAVYDQASNTCNLARKTAENETKACTSRNDCLDLSLNCDLTVPRTCKRGYLASCFLDSDCITSLKCVNQLCDCVRLLFVLKYVNWGWNGTIK